MKPTIRILVIEDERNILSFITSVLESQNYQVIPASNAIGRTFPGRFFHA